MTEEALQKEPGSNRRKIVFINPPFQKSMLKWSIGVALGIMVFTWLMNYWLMSNFINQAIHYGYAQDQAFYSFLLDQRVLIITIQLISLVVVVAVTGGGMALLSHRIAGPIYKLQKHLQELSEGTTDDDVRFREKDYFPELAESFNRYTEVLRSRIEKEAKSQK